MVRLRLIAFLLVLFPVASLFAQGRGPSSGATAPPSPVGRVVTEMTRVEEQLRLRINALQRDAFITSQMVAGANDLTDFQKNAAVSKARDRVRAAQKRGFEQPVMSDATRDLLQSVGQDLDHAHKNAGMADCPRCGR